MQPNEFGSSKAQQWAEVADSATRHLVSRVPMSTDAELSAAVDSAEAAFPIWRDAGILKKELPTRSQVAFPPNASKFALQRRLTNAA